MADLTVTIPAELLREFGQDVRYAARVDRRRALSTTLALAALALAIGASTGVFSVVNALLLRSLPFRHAERLVLEQRLLQRFDADSAALAVWTATSRIVHMDPTAALRAE